MKLQLVNQGFSLVKFRQLHFSAWPTFKLFFILIFYSYQLSNVSNKIIKSNNHTEHRKLWEQTVEKKVFAATRLEKKAFKKDINIVSSCHTLSIHSYALSTVHKKDVHQTYLFSFWKCCLPYEFEDVQSFYQDFFFSVFFTLHALVIYNKLNRIL